LLCFQFFQSGVTCFLNCQRLRGGAPLELFGKIFWNPSCVQLDAPFGTAICTEGHPDTVYPAWSSSSRRRMCGKHSWYSITPDTITCGMMPSLARMLGCGAALVAESRNFLRFPKYLRELNRHFLRSGRSNINSHHQSIPTQNTQATMVA